jgi:hypothetical protein
MNEALSSSETSVLTRATRRNIPEDTILHLSVVQQSKLPTGRRDTAPVEALIVGSNWRFVTCSKHVLFWSYICEWLTDLYGNKLCHSNKLWVLWLIWLMWLMWLICVVSGDFGTYQLRQSLLHMLAALTAGLHMLTLVTVAAVPDHRSVQCFPRASDHHKLSSLQNFLRNA